MATGLDETGTRPVRDVPTLVDETRTRPDRRPGVGRDGAPRRGRRAARRAAVPRRLQGHARRLLHHARLRPERRRARHWGLTPVPGRELRDLAAERLAARRRHPRHGSPGGGRRPRARAGHGARRRCGPVRLAGRARAATAPCVGGPDRRAPRHLADLRLGRRDGVVPRSRRCSSASRATRPTVEWSPAGIVTGLAVLTRPDLAAPRRRPRRPCSSWPPRPGGRAGRCSRSASGPLVALPWHIWSWFVLGSFVPDSLIIKTGGAFPNGEVFGNGPLFMAERWPIPMLVSSASWSAWASVAVVVSACPLDPRVVAAHRPRRRGVQALAGARPLRAPTRRWASRPTSGTTARRWRC